VLWGQVATAAQMAPVVLHEEAGVEMLDQEALVTQLVELVTRYLVRDDHANGTP
jgi:hypothetical protein